MRSLFCTSLFVLSACSIGHIETPSEQASSVASGGSSVHQVVFDPATGLPIADYFVAPIQGFSADDFGFGFGEENTNFCLKTSADGCKEFGRHTGHDTIAKQTQTGTIVVAPADGIVRLTTDVTYGGYGADTKSNASYRGCLLVLEHLLSSGDPVTTLLGHVACESHQAYDPIKFHGNPTVGSVVRRSSYIGHVADYWHGPNTNVNWHHLHWGMRNGRYDATKGAVTYVQGYDVASSFTYDASEKRWIHPQWMDPLIILNVFADPLATTLLGVRHHPAGSLLLDASGSHWVVQNETDVSLIPPDVFRASRFASKAAVRVTDEELRCYRIGPSTSWEGPVTVYGIKGQPTVRMAYDFPFERYDVSRAEALWSWGYSFDDIQYDPARVAVFQTVYANRGLRRMRPGSLIRGEKNPAVFIATPQGTRRAFVDADTFLALGFTWERVVVIPDEVLDIVVGPRDPELVTWETIHQCALHCGSTPCSGGGGPPDSIPEPASPDADPAPVDAGAPFPDAGSTEDTSVPLPEPSLPTEVCNGIDDDGNGFADEVFPCRFGVIGDSCHLSCGRIGYLVCEAPLCTWGACRPFPEDCTNAFDDDCNGFADCEDPACRDLEVCRVAPPPPSPEDAGDPFVQDTNVMDADARDTSASDTAIGVDTSPSTSGSPVIVHLHYEGPIAPGAISIQGWWMPPASGPRAWGAISECVDGVLGDGKLNCTFSLPRGTSPFEFQLYLPDGRYWGDLSDDPKGGHGKTIGAVTMTTSSGPLTIILVPNNPEGKPYNNGHVAFVP